MASKPAAADLPSWPRLLSRDLAAAYVGVSAGTLTLIPVQPVRIGRRVLYDRQSLDAFVDDLSSPGAPAPSGDDWLARLE